MHAQICPKDCLRFSWCMLSSQRGVLAPPFSSKVLGHHTYFGHATYFWGMASPQGYAPQEYFCRPWDDRCWSARNETLVAMKTAQTENLVCALAQAEFGGTLLQGPKEPPKIGAIYFHPTGTPQGYRDHKPLRGPFSS